MNGEMASKLQVSLDRNSIRRIVIEDATQKKEELKRSLKRHFVFLKMDGCTHHRVNNFAINVRYTDDNNKKVTQTLAVRNTYAHHNSEYLSK